MSKTFSQTIWPSSPSVPEPIKALLAKFFLVGDSTSAEASHRLGEEVFTHSGQIVVNKKVILGAEEISTSNHGMLSGFQSRRHKVDKVYTCGEAADDLVLTGTVKWVLKNEQELDGPFAARAIVDQIAGTPKLKLYQGWADMTELMAALKSQS